MLEKGGLTLGDPHKKFQKIRFSDSFDIFYSFDSLRRNVDFPLAMFPSKLTVMGLGLIGSHVAVREDKRTAFDECWSSSERLSAENLRSLVTHMSLLALAKRRLAAFFSICWNGSGLRG